jgi:Tfp pilus assembly protein PilF
VRLPSLALQTYVRGADADPFDVSLLMAGARLAATQKDDALQARLLHRAAAIDPTNPLTALEVAAFDAGHGDLAAAGRELDRALAALPQHADMWAARGQVYAAAKDPAGARAAYQRAVALQADNPVAKHGLAVLDAKP